MFAYKICSLKRGYQMLLLPLTLKRAIKLIRIAICNCHEMRNTDKQRTVEFPLVK